MKLHYHLLLIAIIASNLFGGGGAPIPLGDTESFIAKSTRVFEAEFHELKEVYTYKGEVLTGDDFNELQKVVKALKNNSDKLFYRKWNDDGTPYVERKLTKEEKERNQRLGPFDPEYIGEEFDYLTVSYGENGPQFREAEIKIARSLTLKITKSIKGENPGIYTTFDFIDLIGSACPHIAAMGFFKNPQRYFVFSEERNGKNVQVYRYQDMEAEEDTKGRG